MHQPYRILHCSTAFSTGGRLTWLREALPEIDPGRFENLVCYIRSTGYQSDRLAFLGCPVMCLEVGSPYNLAAGVWRLIRVIRKHHIDLIHMGMSGTEREVFLASMITGVPMLGTLTTTFDPSLQAGYKGRARAWKLRLLHRVLAILARMSGARFLALSDAVKDSAIKHLHLPSDRIDVVPVGLIPEEFEVTKSLKSETARLRAGLGLDGAFPVLISVGRLSLEKGQAELIRTMPLILERFPRARMLLAGDGPLRSELEHLLDRMGLQDRVMLLGQRDDIKTLLFASDIFVLTSYFEGVPHAMIEAMAAGKPIVAFSIPTLEDIIEDGVSGFLVDSRNVELLAHRVAQIASTPALLQTMGERARQIVGDKYDIRRSNQKLEALYQRILTDNYVPIRS